MNIPSVQAFTQTGNEVEWHYLNANHKTVTILAYMEHYSLPLDNGTVFHIHTN